MNLKTLIQDLISKRPQITVVLTLPEEVISKDYHKVSIFIDDVELFGCFGILKNKYIFKGKVKVDLEWMSFLFLDYLQ